jgi:chromosome segregation ATPase
MECVAHSEIRETANTISDFSYNEKKYLSVKFDTQVNKLLDTIYEFKAVLRKKTHTLNEINEKIEKITWYNDLDEECFKLLNNLIASAKDAHSSLVRQYISMNKPAFLKCASQEIRDFKTSIDELKESYQDLESVFFYLPQMDDFVDISKQLSLI